MVNPGFESPEHSSDAHYNNDKNASSRNFHQKKHQHDEESLQIAGLPDGGYSPRAGTLSTQKGLLDNNRLNRQQFMGSALSMSGQNNNLRADLSPDIRN